MTATYITRESAAKELGVTVETVDTLVGLFDDADLYDAENDLVSVLGMDLLAAQVASDTTQDKCF